MSCTLKSCALYSSVAIFKTEKSPTEVQRFSCFEECVYEHNTSCCLVSDHKWSPVINKVPNFHTHVKASILGERWWEKSMKPNMVEIKSAKHLIDSLNEAGDRLVVVDFYSPACGGCKTLHPKMQFLKESRRAQIYVLLSQHSLGSIEVLKGDFVASAAPMQLSRSSRSKEQD